MGKDDLLEQLERMKPVRYIELVKVNDRCRPLLSEFNY